MTSRVFTTRNFADDLRDLLRYLTEKPQGTILLELFGKTITNRVQSLILKAMDSPYENAEDFTRTLSDEDHATIAFLIHVTKDLILSRPVQGSWIANNRELAEFILTLPDELRKQVAEHAYRWDQKRKSQGGAR